jgi:hypothetical protein
LLAFGLALNAIGDGRGEYARYEHDDDKVQCSGLHGKSPFATVTVIPKQ